MQYHPDVCKGGNSSVEFHQINEAYHVSHHCLVEQFDANPDLVTISFQYRLDLRKKKVDFLWTFLSWIVSDGDEQL